MEYPDDVIATNCGVIYAAGGGKVANSGDYGSTWREMFCPVEHPTDLAADDTFLVVGGGCTFAACAHHHEGRAWQMVELPGEIACIALYNKVAHVGTTDGRLFVLKLSWRPSLLERLFPSIARTSPCIEINEWGQCRAPATSPPDITWGWDTDSAKTAS